MKVPFQVTGYVWVKLTPFGLKILENSHNWLRASFPNLPEFTPPPTDENGYARYQLWSLMNDFGQYMTMGGKVPFETDILLEMKEK